MVSNSHAVRMAGLANSLAPLDDPALFVTGDSLDPRHYTDWNGFAGPRPLGVLRPRDTAQVAAALRATHALAQPIAIQGGLTGLVQGALASADEVVLSMERMRTIEEIDEANQSLTVQAGVTLQEAQEAAAARGLLLPVDIGSKGSCQMGGIAATNAGGNRVLRHGMARQCILGLEAVLADGTVISHLGKALKDNAGFDLKQLFIGSEGTLGVITRLVCALQPMPLTRQTALVSVSDFNQMVALLRHCRSRLGPRLSSFEAMWRDFFDTALCVAGFAQAPIAHPGPLLVLVEAMGQEPATDDEHFLSVLGEFLEQTPGSDAVVAQSLHDANRLWALREASGEAASAIRPYASFDVSLPIARMADWLASTHEALAAMGLSQTQTYGHLGDGNLHLVVGYPTDRPEMKARINDLVHGSIGSLGGSISGEHGIGLSKRTYLHMSRSREEIALMRALKHTMDPLGLLNRGRVLAHP